MRILTPNASGAMPPSGNAIVNPGFASVSGIIAATADVVSPTVDFYTSTGGVYEFSGYLNLISTTVAPASSILTLWLEYTTDGAINTHPVTMNTLDVAPPNSGFSTLSFAADAGTPISWWYAVSLFTSGTASIEYRIATIQRV